MPFKVELEPPDMWSEPRERCCFCRRPTRYWRARPNVACCQPCAATHTIFELPTKHDWCAKESAISAAERGSKP